MNYSYRNTDIFSTMTSMGPGMVVLEIALIIFGIVCMWKIFEKAGEAGWKSLIPIYSGYIYFKIAWETKYFWIVLLAALVPGILLGVAGGTPFASIISIIAYIVILVIAIIAIVKLTKRFGKSGGFAVGMILLSIIFMAILAFGSADYDRSRA